MQIIQNCLRQALLARNVSAAARRTAMRVAKFNSNGFIIDVPNQLFRDKERAAANQILSNGLCTAASRQNDVIIQPLRQLLNVFRAGDAVRVQHSREFVAVHLRHMLQPLGKLIDALDFALCGKIYAAQIQP